MIGQFDLREKIIHADAGEQNRVAEIHGERSGGVVVDHHRIGDVIETRAAFGREREQALHHIRRASRNIRHGNLLRAGRGPARDGRGRGPISLARDEHDDALVHARRNISGERGIGERGAFAGSHLADAIEKSVVKLARQIGAHESIGKRHVLAAEMRGGSELQIRLQARDQDAERAGRSFLVDCAGRIEDQQALDEIRGDVSFERVDVGRAGERRELRDEARARAHAAGEEFHVGAIGRHAGRNVGGIEQGEPGAEGGERQRRKSFDGHGFV